MINDFSAVFNAHPQYIDTMYQSWLADPTSVEADWQAFFKGFDFALNANSTLGPEASPPAPLQTERGVSTPPLRGGWGGLNRASSAG